MASTLGKMITVFRFNSLLSTPSSRKLLSRVRMPLATKVEDIRQPSLPDPSLFAPGTTKAGEIRPWQSHNSAVSYTVLLEIVESYLYPAVQVTRIALLIEIPP